MIARYTRCRCIKHNDAFGSLMQVNIRLEDDYYDVIINSTLTVQ